MRMGISLLTALTGIHRQFLMKMHFERINKRCCINRNGFTSGHHGSFPKDVLRHQESAGRAEVYEHTISSHLV